jgi:hypothetical protein
MRVLSVFGRILPRSKRLLALALILLPRIYAQNRGLYPLGMSAVNSGVTPAPGFTYANQLLTYGRNEAKDDAGSTLPLNGSNTVVMDMNTIAWVSRATFLGGARFSATATLPFAKNDLTSDLNGNLSGGAGFADSFYLPVILGWNKERVAFRLQGGFLAPTGRFAVGANDNVGSGYWTVTPSAGQTFYLTKSKSLALSLFEMYEIHTTQEGSGTRPGDTFDLDYSLMRTFVIAKGGAQIGAGVAGYEARQTTAKTGPQITAEESGARYAINAIGAAASLAFPKRKVSFGVKFFQEFADRSTYQGRSLQFSGSIGL